MQRIPMTAGGFSRLQEELKHLKTVERIAVIKAISEARALGDLSENAEYHQAREDQGKLEERIHKIERILESSETVVGGGGDIIEIGSSVLGLSDVTIVNSL